MSHPSSESRPSPWLTYITPIVLAAVTSIATTTFTAGERTAELRHVQDTQAAHGKRLESLETYRGDLREALAKLSEQVQRARDDVAELKELLRPGRTTR